MSAAFPAMRFLWLDVEDLEDVVEDLDVETFPTLLIGTDEQAYFLGPLLPQMRVLERMLGNFHNGDVPMSGLPVDATLLLQRVITDYYQSENRYRFAV